MHTKTCALPVCWISDSYCKQAPGLQEGITELCEVMPSGHSNSVQYAGYQTPATASHQSFEMSHYVPVSLVQ